MQIYRLNVDGSWRGDGWERERERESEREWERVRESDREKKTRKGKGEKMNVKVKPGNEMTKWHNEKWNMRAPVLRSIDKVRVWSDQSRVRRRMDEQQRLTKEKNVSQDHKHDF